MNTKLNSGHANVNEMSARLMDDLKSAVAEGDHMLKEMASATADEVSSARSRIEATVHGARTRLDDARILVAKRAQHAAEVSVDYVKENPWKTLGVVAAAGLIAGILLNRRH